MTQRKLGLKTFLGAAMFGGMVLLAGCGDDTPQPTSVSTTTQETTTAPAPAPMTAPLTAGAPGTVTTQTTHSESGPAQ